MPADFSSKVSRSFGYAQLLKIANKQNKLELNQNLLNLRCNNLQINPQNNKAIDSSITHIRPRFKLMVPYTQEEVMSRAKQLLQNTPDNIKGVRANDLIILNIAGDDVHYWSPQLNLRIEADDENEEQTKVSGLIGPRPAVWTLFMFIYFVVGTLGLFISSFAVSKIMMGVSSNLIAVFPITIVFLLTAYGVGKYGERLAKDQMELLKDFVRQVVDMQAQDNTETPKSEPVS